MRVAYVQAVPSARGVVVELPRVWDQPVVRGIVDALERQSRAEVIALRSVVVDDVEYHLDAGLMQGPDHRLELRNLLASLASGSVVVVRGEEADRVVAPVVAESAPDQLSIVHELMHWQQFDRGETQFGQVVERRRVGQARIGTALRRRYVRVPRGESFHVDLIDDRLVQRDIRRAVVAPVEERVVHHRPGHVRGAVVGVAGVLVAEVVQAAIAVSNIRAAPSASNARNQADRLHHPVGTAVRATARL
jgi:hypothetical protein